MEKVTREYTIYKYDELTDEQKEKVLQNLWDIKVDGDFWYDYDGKFGLSTKEMKSRHIKGEECPTDLLSWKHLYFDIDRDSYIQFDNPSIVNEDVFRRFLRIPKRLWAKISVYFPRPSRNQNTTIEFEETSGHITNKENTILDRAKEIFDGKVHEALTNLRQSYEYCTSREAIEETIRINDYNFTEDGKIF